MPALATALDTPLAEVPGIGPVRRRALAAAGLQRLGDCLWGFGRQLPPLETSLAATNEWPVATRLSLAAVVEAITVRGFRRQRQLWLRCRLLGESHGASPGESHGASPGAAGLQVCFFQTFLRRNFVLGQAYRFTGLSDKRGRRILYQPSFSPLADAEEPNSLQLLWRDLPAGIGAGLASDLLERALAALDDSPPTDPLQELVPASWRDLLRSAHRPPDRDAFLASRRALAQRELAALALQLQARRQALRRPRHSSCIWPPELLAALLACLPFTLSADQARVLAEIRADLQAPQRMLRLVAGEVGSGKTALACLAAGAVIATGAQVVVLAPTAVLAHQHAQFFTQCLQARSVRIGLLRAEADDRAALQSAFAEGEIDLLIGSHVVLNSGLRGRHIGLVICDEEHRFGVEQRRRLLDGLAPAADFLSLSATPIPRSLALSHYGEMDLSTLPARPGGARVSSSLQVLHEATIRAALEQCLRAGGRVFVIAARKELGDAQLLSAEALQQQLHTWLPSAGCRLLSADTKAEQALATLAAFAAGDCRILVATSVVEVGIDVPAATLAIVCNAERFGLAQLHQLRGRLARGDQDGHCLFLHAAATDTQRLQILLATDDGLQIAEADLQRRGCGELLGRRQHGAAPWRWAELPGDAELLEWATRAAASGALPATMAAWMPADV